MAQFFLLHTKPTLCTLQFLIDHLDTHASLKMLLATHQRWPDFIDGLFSETCQTLAWEELHDGNDILFSIGNCTSRSQGTVVYFIFLFSYNRTSFVFLKIGRLELHNAVTGQYFGDEI